MATLADLEEMDSLLDGVPDAEEGPDEESFALSPSPSGFPDRPSLALAPEPIAEPAASPAEETPAPAASQEPAPEPEPAKAPASPPPPAQDPMEPLRSYLDARGVARMRQIVELIPQSQRQDFLMFVGHYRLHPDDASVAAAGLAAFVAEAARDIPEGVDRVRKAMAADHDRFLAESQDALEGRSAALAAQLEETIHIAHDTALSSLEERFSGMLDAARETGAAAEKSLKEVSALASAAGEAARDAIGQASKEMLPTMAEAFEKSWDRGLERIKQALAEEEKAGKIRLEEFARKAEAGLADANRKALDRALAISEKVARAEIAASKARAVWVPIALAGGFFALGALGASLAILLLK